MCAAVASMVVTMRQVMTRDGELYGYRPIPPLSKSISGDDYTPVPTVHGAAGPVAVSAADAGGGWHAAHTEPPPASGGSMRYRLPCRTSTVHLPPPPRHRRP